MTWQYVNTRLYYPSQWRRCVSSLDLSPEEKKFSWFLCGKPMKDDKSGMNIVRVSRTAKFYDIASGHTLVQADPDRQLDLLISEDQPAPYTLTEYGYGGWAKPTRCTLRNPDQWVLCHDASFSFLPGVVRPYKKENVCEMMLFAKRYNEAIRARISSFPDVATIEDRMKEKGCAEVCRRLYPMLLRYVED